MQISGPPRCISDLRSCKHMQTCKHNQGFFHAFHALLLPFKISLNITRHGHSNFLHYPGMEPWSDKTTARRNN